MTERNQTLHLIEGAYVGVGVVGGYAGAHLYRLNEGHIVVIVAATVNSGARSLGSDLKLADLAFILRDPIADFPDRAVFGAVLYLFPLVNLS